MKDPRTVPRKAPRLADECVPPPDAITQDRPTSNDCSPTRQELIAAAAYDLAEQRGFAPGCELDDWLAAERLVDDRLRKTSTNSD